MIISDDKMEKIVAEYYHIIALSPEDFKLGLSVARDIYESWISTEDLEPEEGEDVEVCNVKNGIRGYGHIFNKDFPVDRKWAVNGRSGTGHQPTHWRPLVDMP